MTYLLLWACPGRLKSCAFFRAVCQYNVRKKRENNIPFFCIPAGFGNSMETFYNYLIVYKMTNVN